MPGLARRRPRRAWPAGSPPAQWEAVEHGVAVVTGRMLSLLPAERAAALADGPVTIDLDTTDVEVSADLPVVPRAVRFSCSMS